MPDGRIFGSCGPDQAVTAFPTSSIWPVKLIPIARNGGRTKRAPTKVTPKGQGAAARYVVLLAEAHGYAAREHLLHMLWEMDTWLNKYVKNPAPQPAS